MDEYNQPHFGLDAPRGGRWYNFDVPTYLECGVRGTYGGYEADEVIVLIPPPEGETADSPQYTVEQFNWSDFIELLQNGRFYE